MPQNNEKQLEKLKKLLALAKSDNPHEAALALQRAQRLMQTYNITQADLALSDIDESISRYWAAGSVNPPRYMLGLLDIIQVAFGVKSIIHSGFKPSVGFYSNKDRVALASYTWEVLARQLIAARKSYIGQQNKRAKNKTSRGDKFAEGWVLAVCGEAHLFAMSREERELAKLWLEQKYPESGTTMGREAGKSRDADMSRHLGYREGENIRLHQPVHGQEQRKLGGAIMAAFIVSGVFWYGFVGWCTAQLHLYMGFYSRYQGAKRWISWSVICLLWPLTLPLFVDFVSQRDAGDDIHD